MACNSITNYITSQYGFNHIRKVITTLKIPLATSIADFKNNGYGTLHNLDITLDNALISFFNSNLANGDIEYGATANNDVANLKFLVCILFSDKTTASMFMYHFLDFRDLSKF